MIVGVLVELSSKNIDKEFDYLVPNSLIKDIKLGIRVLVPFGNMTLEGFIVSIKDNSTSSNLKEIIDIKDKDIILNEELLELGKWMRDNTLSTLISCYQTMLPKALKVNSKSKDINIKYETFYKLNDIDLSNYNFNSKQLEIINVLKSGDCSRTKLINISSSSINTLLKKDIISCYKKELYRLNYDDVKTNKKVLTSEQDNVVKEVINNGHGTYLLHGVTGSGKTEVYMEIIDYYLKKGKTCIVLVPEISLTPQMVNRFRIRFGDNIAAIHSALSEGEKYDEYRRIVKGDASIVIGARSAIFAPLKNIGCIIVDEEHSDSYKQTDMNPRYSAKDVAIKRSETYKCPVVFGSATPSLEYMARAKKGVFHLLELPKRINGKELPIVNIVDMNKEFRTCKGHFSNILLDTIKDKVNNNEQVILLLNRRGYSSVITCKNCHYTFKCPNCDITLTYHKTNNTLRCHYCGYGDKVHEVCPECKENSLADIGIGTERIQEEIEEFIPGIRVIRMDFDTTSKKGAHEKLINKFREHEADVLLGTQIVAKGLDFDNVTLVGVINADTSLNIPDFRSSENTFSLLSQVAGRSGRSTKNGSVIIQTYNPDHYAISYVKNHDYIGFYNKEMSFRRLMKYPPYYYLCSIRISGKDPKYIFEESLKIKKVLSKELNSSIILGPSTCSIFKVNNVFRYNIILKYKKEDNLYKVLERVIDHYKGNNKIKIDIDFNPSQMM